MTTATRTVRDAIDQGLFLAGIRSPGENAASEDAAEAAKVLDAMLKEWQAFGHSLWTKTAGSLALTASTAEYTLDPVRPLQIESARLKTSDGNEISMTRMTREEYDSLPIKSTTGLPTQFYYDRQREAARFYVWPTLDTDNGETVEYTYIREIEDMTDLNAVLDVPGEWWSAVTYNLGQRLIEAYGLQGNPLIAQRAQLLLNRALAFDREGSVFFGGFDD